MLLGSTDAVVSVGRMILVGMVGTVRRRGIVGTDTAVGYDAG